LNDYHDNSQKMRYSKPEISDPGPSTYLAYDDKEKTYHDESDKKHVQKQDRIGS